MPCARWICRCCSAAGAGDDLLHSCEERINGKIQSLCSKSPQKTTSKVHRIICFPTLAWSGRWVTLFQSREVEAEVLIRLAKGQGMGSRIMESQHLALAGGQRSCSKASHQAQLPCWDHLSVSCADTCGSSHFGHFTVTSCEEVLMVLTPASLGVSTHTHTPTHGLHLSSDLGP